MSTVRAMRRILVMLAVLAMVTIPTGCGELQGVTGNQVYTIYRVGNPYSYLPGSEYRPMYYNRGNVYGAYRIASKPKREKRTYNASRRSYKPAESSSRRRTATNRDRSKQ